MLVSPAVKDAPWRRGAFKLIALLLPSTVGR